MTRVTYSNDGRVFKLGLEGHAGYDNEGKDIVCSSISTITYMLTNELLVHCDSIFCNHSLKSGDVKISAHARNEIGMTVCEVLFNAAVRTLKGLAKMYPENVSFTS